MPEQPVHGPRFKTCGPRTVASQLSRSTALRSWRAWPSPGPGAARSGEPRYIPLRDRLSALRSLGGRMLSVSVWEQPAAHSSNTQSLGQAAFAMQRFSLRFFSVRRIRSLAARRAFAVRPNPSFEARPNGRPPWPGLRYAVHFLSPGQGALPLVPPQLKR